MSRLKKWLLVTQLKHLLECRSLTHNGVSLKYTRTSSWLGVHSVQSFPEWVCVCFKQGMHLPFTTVFRAKHPDHTDLEVGLSIEAGCGNVTSPICTIRWQQHQVNWESLIFSHTNNVSHLDVYADTNNCNKYRSNKYLNLLWS